MEIASYRDNPPEQQRSRSPARLYSPTTTTPLSFRSNEVDTERKLGTGVDNRVKQKERPKRIIGDGNIYGHSSTTSYADRDNHISSSSNHDDDDQEIEAALALALPTSPITDAVPLREAANVPVDTRDGNNGRSLLRENINPFQTGLGLRHNWEACAAYVMLPPVGSVGLLLLEQQSDYVRYVITSSLIFYQYHMARVGAARKTYC